jgi:hypothetical protein
VIVTGFDAVRKETVQRTVGSWHGGIVLVNSRLCVGSLQRLYGWEDEGEPGLHYGRYRAADRDWFFESAGRTWRGFGLASAWHADGGVFVPHWLLVLFLAAIFWWSAWRLARLRRRRIAV